MLLEWIIKRNDKNPTAHAEVAHISRERLSLCCCSMYLHVQYQLFVCSHQCSDLICTTLLSPPFHQHWHWISKPKLSPLLLEISCFYLYLFFFFFFLFPCRMSSLPFDSRSSRPRRRRHLCKIQFVAPLPQSCFLNSAPSRAAFVQGGIKALP